MSRKTTMIAAIREAIDEEMLRDENVIVLGEDIGELGGPLSANGASPASAWARPCAASAPSSS